MRLVNFWMVLFEMGSLIYFDWFKRLPDVRVSTQ